MLDHHYHTELIGASSPPDECKLFMNSQLIWHMVHDLCHKCIDQELAHISFYSFVLFYVYVIIFSNSNRFLRIVLIWISVLFSRCHYRRTSNILMFIDAQISSYQTLSQSMHGKVSYLYTFLWWFFFGFALTLVTELQP